MFGPAYFEKLLSQQSSEGYWTELPELPAWSLDVRDTLGQELAATVTDALILERVIFTLIALYIMKERYEEKEDEWQMIARKAKAYLKLQAGIQKVEPWFKKIVGF